MQKLQLAVNQYDWQIILNSNALQSSTSDYWDNIKDKFQSENIPFQYHHSDSIEQGEEIIKNLCKEGKRHFVVIGGDGSLNFFVNAIMKSDIDSREVYATLIPLGTGNDWARSHHYPLQYMQCIDSFIQGNFVKHDIGCVEVQNAFSVSKHYFLNIAGFGFDAQVIKNTEGKKYDYFRNQMYLLSLLNTLFSFKAKPITITTSERTISESVFSIACGINQYNGNGMRQCPNAIYDDGLFHLVVIRNVSPFKVVANVKRLFDGTHITHIKEIIHWDTSHIFIKGCDGFYCEVEGEMIPIGDYDISVIPCAINLMSVIS